MELLERVQRMKRHFDIPEDPNLPWFRRKKNILLLGIGLLVILAVVVLFAGGYFAGLSSFGDEKDNTLVEPESRIQLPPLQWDGSCPKKVDECPASFEGNPPVILVSLDGFFPSLMERGFTPTIKNMSKCGTHAPYMFPVFPTKTFPNHYSQVTGLFPPYHGIIDNNMYDPVMRKLFKVGTPESLNPRWWQKEPIWVTAQKQGKRSGCFFWPGSDIEINGTYPTYYKKYNSRLSFESRVDQLLYWLDLPPPSRPHLLTLYVNQPDHTLHYFGTKSKQLNDALIKVDNMIDRLFSGLQQRKLINCVNVIIMSDHGMSDTDCRHVIDVQHYINVNDNFITAGPFGRLRPKGRRNVTLINDMVSKLRCKSDHMRVFPKEQLPVRYHFSDNQRIEPVFLDIDAGWTVVSKSVVKADDSICSGGAHGYDNMFPDMRATFLAYGPSFKKNYVMKPFLNVEIYEMLSELLGISPNPNNGTRGSMHHIMTAPKLLKSQSEADPPTVAYIPTDEKVYNDRLSASTCYCPESGKQINVQDIDNTKNTHLPFGIPHSPDEDQSLNLLYNEDYVSAFHLKFKVPMWSSFTLKGQIPHNKEVLDLCWNGDVRIPSESMPKCSDYVKLTESDEYILQRPLFSPAFSESDSSVREQAILITNSVAKSFNFSSVVEVAFNEMLNRWISESREVNVVTGPAFDIFGVGVKPESKEIMKYFERNGPILIPTHFFVITTWCSINVDSLNNCDPSKLLAQGFLLPNQPFPMNCDAASNIITKNVARIADIENLTGLFFYKKLPIYDAIRLRTMMPERPF